MDTFNKKRTWQVKGKEQKKRQEFEKSQVSKVKKSRCPQYDDSHGEDSSKLGLQKLHGSIINRVLSYFKETERTKTFWIFPAPLCQV